MGYQTCVPADPNSSILGLFKGISDIDIDITMNKNLTPRDTFLHTTWRYGHTHKKVTQTLKKITETHPGNLSSWVWVSRASRPNASSIIISWRNLWEKNASKKCCQICPSLCLLCVLSLCWQINYTQKRLQGRWRESLQPELCKKRTVYTYWIIKKATSWTDKQRLRSKQTSALDHSHNIIVCVLLTVCMRKRFGKT